MANTSKKISDGEKKKAAEGDDAADDAAGKKADDGKADDKADDPPPKKLEKTFTKAELDAANKKAVEDAQKKWESEKDLSEMERIKKENEDLRAANRLRDAKDEVLAELTKAGNNSPELAFRAIQGDLQFDEKTGKLTNAKDLIDGFKTSYPEQFGTAKPAGGVDAGAGGGEKGAGVTQAQLEKMTPQEVSALPWDDVKAAMTAKQ